MKGCLVKNAEAEYFLVSQRGSRVKLDVAEDIASYVGQQVKASGAFVDAHEPGSSAPPANTAGPNSKGAVHPEREFRVLKIDVLSQSCAPTLGKKR
jgi:hypothetical protein